MKHLLILILSSILIQSCGNEQNNLNEINKQLDLDINHTKKYIREELVSIEKSLVMRLGENIKNICYKIKDQSDKIDSIFESSVNSKQFNQTQLLDEVNNQIIVLSNYVVEDGNPDNDYLKQIFEEITESLPKQNLSPIQIKILHSQLKKAELKVWGYLKKSLYGEGLTMDHLEAFHQLDETSTKDSISAKIILDSYSSRIKAFLHFGKIDSTRFSFDTGSSTRLFNHIMYPAAAIVKVPLIGKYQSASFKDWKNKKIKVANQNLVNGKIEGVLELRSPNGTIFLTINRPIK